MLVTHHVGGSPSIGALRWAYSITSLAMVRRRTGRTDFGGDSLANAMDDLPYAR